MEDIKEININHPDYGVIEISTSIPNDINELIGDVVGDCDKLPHLYHANVVKNEEGNFDISQLKVIKPEGVNVGWMQNSKGSKNFITVIKNTHVGDDITIYPSGVISVKYNQSNQ